MDESPQKEWQSRHLWEIQPVRDTILVAAVLGLIYGGYVLGTVTVPMLVALALAYLVEPVVAWLTRKFPRIGRQAVVGIMLALIVSAVSLGLAIAIPAAAAQASQLRENSPRYAKSFRRMLERTEMPEWLKGGVQPLIELLPTGEEPRSTVVVTPGTPVVVVPAPATVPPILPPLGKPPELTEARIREIFHEEELKRVQLAHDPVSGEVSDFSGIANKSLRALTVLGRIAGGVATLLFFVTISGICFFYFSSSFPHIRRFGRSMLPRANKERLLDLISKMDMAISAFVRGRLLISMMLTLLYVVGWSIMGVPHAILLGLFAGVCSIVPYLAWSALPIAWIMLAVTLSGATSAGMYVSQAAGVLPETGSGLSIIWWKVFVFPFVVTALIQSVEDYVLTPTIQGQATNLHPLTISLAVIAGGSLAGLYGMLLAIPSAACIKILINELLMPRVNAWLKGEHEDPIPM